MLVQIKLIALIPKDSIITKIDSTSKLQYSPRKCIANRSLEYSIKCPAISSDSHSVKSNGTLPVSIRTKLKRTRRTTIEINDKEKNRLTKRRQLKS